ncbi:MAG: hypothetical protein CM15mV20_2000 [uncultured marine virus]|nr:MAG: hypothetical protein CM15mV20_2000 [uncultured marine virus]
MADRIPLIVNATAGQIQELGAVDYYLSGVTPTMLRVVTMSGNDATLSNIL